MDEDTVKSVCFQRGGAKFTLLLWKGCKLQKRLGTHCMF